MIDEDGFDCDLDASERPHDEWSESERLSRERYELTPAGEYVLHRRCSGTAWAAAEREPWVPPSRGCRPKRHCRGSCSGHALPHAPEVIIPEPGQSWRLWLAWKLLRLVLWLVGAFQEPRR